MSYLEMAIEALHKMKGATPIRPHLKQEPRETPPVTEPAELPDMPLDDFAEAGLVVTVWSELLGRDVLFVSDDVPEDAIREMEGAVYRARELRKLQSIEPSARHLRTVHAVKEIFGGRIVDAEPREP